MPIPFSSIIDLGHEMYTGMPVLDDNVTNQFWENNTFDGMARYSDGKISARSRMMLLFEHVSTHVDAPGHFDKDGMTIDQIPLTQLVVPGHLLDLTHKKPFEGIGPDDFAEAVEKSGKPIEPNTIVIANTGQYKTWGKGDFRTARPYITGEGGQWMVDAGATLFGTDLIGIDNPTEMWNPTHTAFLMNGVPMIQQLNNLDALIGLDFLFVALPWQMLGGTASPVRPIALVA
ncbi:cyclase family protein [soil metagenome]